MSDIHLLNDRIVAKTMIPVNGDRVDISTVFTGIDRIEHKGNPPKPTLWETTISGGPMDNYSQRYTSYEEARAGHSVAVMLAKAAKAM